MTVCERIKKVRVEEKLSQNEFAERLNVSRSTLMLIEQGKREVNTKVLEALKSEFDISADWVLFGSDAGVSNNSEEQNSRRMLELSILTPCLTHFMPFIEALGNFAQKDSKTYERIKAIRSGIDEIKERTELINNIKTKTEYGLFDETKLEISKIIDDQFWVILKKVQELTRFINISDADTLQSIVPKYYDHIENYLGGLEQQINNFLKQQDKAKK